MAQLARLGGDIAEMQRTLRDVISKSDQLGGFGDGPQLREEIQTDVRNLMNLSQAVKSNLVEAKQSGLAVDEYESQLAELRAAMQENLPRVIQRLKQNTETHEQSPHESAMNQPLLDQTLLDEQTEQLDELQQAVSGILTMMTEVNMLFKQTLEEIQRHRHMLTAIESHTNEGKENMEKGNEQLEKAASHQKGSTKCLIWLFVILGVIAAGITVFLVLKFRPRK